MVSALHTVPMNPNVFMINVVMLLLTTTLVGGIMTLIWLGIGKLLEIAGFINITFELLKMAVFFYCFPMVYVLLKIFERELGRGYLFGPTPIIVSLSKGFLMVYCLGILIALAYIMLDANKLKKKYADCFSSDEPEMMIETLSPAMCINKFPAKKRTVYTVYNRAYRTYRGDAFRIPHEEGNTYYDVWNDAPLNVRIESGYATVELEVDAQSIGCILVNRAKS